ncbi:MAG TPA: MFS transporter [Streptosporangiaceae bacterium]|jgi:MFS family permease
MPSTGNNSTAELTAPAPGPLRDPAYRSWFFSQALSSAGVQTQTIGAAWVVYLETHSGVALALIPVATLGPGLLLGVFAGALLDRRDARSVLLVTQALALIAGSALGVISLNRTPPLAAIFGICFLTGLINAFDGPARQVIVVDFVGRHRVDQAVSLFEVSLSLSRMAGPALGGVLLDLLGPAACFFFNAGTYAGPLIVLAVYTPQYAASAEERAQRTSAPRAAARFAFHSGPIRSCMLIAALCTTVVTTTAYFPEFSAESLHLGSKGYGALVACLGIGALPGALLAARLAGQDRGRRVAISALGVGVATLVTGLAPDAALAFAGTILIGLASICLLALANTLVQLLAPPFLRGGIMGLWVMMMPGMTPITGFGTGFLTDTLGPRSVFFVITVVMTVLVALCWRPLRRDALPDS